MKKKLKTKNKRKIAFVKMPKEKYPEENDLKMNIWEQKTRLINLKLSEYSIQLIHFSIF